MTTEAQTRTDLIDPNQVARCRKDAVNQSSINPGDVKSLEVRLPPLDLRQEFVELVDRVLVLRTTLTRRADSADELTASLTQRAFRGDL